MCRPNSGFSSHNKWCEGFWVSVAKIALSILLSVVVLGLLASGIYFILTHKSSEERAIKAVRIARIFDDSTWPGTVDSFVAHNMSL